ncbi:hypothetical protein TNIN_141961 [Trichonephila inaurata madagascariensis]|uniref:Uncharacterized protein n=1 Tax=Trichonephila inaurata madagascariensis TaxID=2747483 RepID=A0A8X6IH95_9ARAC|nr:hypothetical protein TNIN_141961 [Trichonephila inaurata madagascariensis]
MHQPNSKPGHSLKDLPMVGPRGAKRRVSNFCFPLEHFQIAVCADVEKMFRQKKISWENTNWQRILWRDNPKELVKGNRLTTPPMGPLGAPYLFQFWEPLYST